MYACLNYHKEKRKIGKLGYKDQSALSYPKKNPETKVTRTVTFKLKKKKLFRKFVTLSTGSLDSNPRVSKSSLDCNLK